MLKAVNSEIRHLRELSMCDNVITLESVYKTTTSENHMPQLKFHLVLKYSEYGCLRTFIIENATIAEAKIRQIMQ